MSVSLSKTEFIWKLADYLGCFSDEIVSFKVWEKVIWVHVKGNRPTFISRESFASMVRRDSAVWDGVKNHQVIALREKQKQAYKRIKSRRKIRVTTDEPLKVSAEGKKHPLLAHLEVA